VVEVLKQPQFSPVPVEEQVLAIYAVTEGHMDDVALRDVARFEMGLREFFRARHTSLLGTIADTGKMPESADMDNAIAAYKETFEGSLIEE
jgi:F-type H+-transporting ATPase subunit alpha